MNTENLMGRNLNFNKRGFVIGAVQVAAWLFFFLWPWLLFQGETPKFERFYLRYLIFPCLGVILFYVNYCLWVPRYFFGHKVARFVFCNLALLCVCLILIQFWHENVMDFIFGIPPGKRPPGKGFHWFFHFQNFLNLLTMVVVALVLRLIGRWYKSEIDRQALAGERNLAELKNLKSQLHPHFLFNTLNNIYALIEIEPEQAQEAVYDLGNLLRYVLKESERERVPLRDEVCFMQNYIGLMKLRLNEKTRLQVEFPPEEQTQHCSIPPLLFINLIENAFKHGIGSSPSMISVRMEIDRRQDRLTFTCRNTLAERPRGEGRLMQEDTGVGLVNLQKRLAYIYGQDCRFLTEEREGMYTASLAIPLDFE